MASETNIVMVSIQPWLDHEEPVPNEEKQTPAKQD